VSDDRLAEQSAGLRGLDTKERRRSMSVVSGIVDREADKRNTQQKPKFHYADFHRNFPAEKVVDTNHESLRRDFCRGLS